MSPFGAARNQRAGQLKENSDMRTFSLVSIVGMGLVARWDRLRSPCTLASRRPTASRG
jgi:hypothetical protein